MHEDKLNYNSSSAENAVKNADFRKSESRTRALLTRAWLLERMLLYFSYLQQSNFAAPLSALKIRML